MFLNFFKKILVLGLDQDTNPKKINLGLDSEFNSTNYGIDIKKCLKFVRPKKCLGVKICEKFFYFKFVSSFKF